MTKNAARQRRHPLELISRWLRALNRRRLARRKRVRRVAAERAWFNADDPLRPGTLAALQSRLQSLGSRPRLEIVLHPAHGEIVAAGWPFWQQTIYPAQAIDMPSRPAPLQDDAIRRFNDRIRLGDADAWVIVPGNGLLAPHALLLIAEALDRFPEARLIYADEDHLNLATGNRHGAQMYCDWNSELFRSTNYLRGMVVVTRAAVREANELHAGEIDATWWDWLFRTVEWSGPKGVLHVPHVLYHRTSPDPETQPGQLDRATAAEVQVVQSHLDRCQIAGRAEASTIGGVHVRYLWPEPAPLVSMIVPTRNAVALLRQCVQSILERTRYPAFEIVIVDNGSDDPAALEYMRSIAAEPRVRVHRDERPFNYAALNNEAAKLCRGSLLALVNNDIEVISPDWLDEMVGLALRTDVGAVGARLWYPDDTLQHAGVVLGIGGVAGHWHRQLPRGSPGYQGRAHLTQEFSAVTAACLVMRRSVFDELRGLDATNLAIDYNDIDLCLRIRAAGYRVIWTPHAELYHHESASRGRERPREQQARYDREVAYMRRTWGQALERDPAYNPNLSLQDAEVCLTDTPRVDLATAWFQTR